jgi:tetratricopeptide (TPR) repeat protein
VEDAMLGLVLGLWLAGTPQQGADAQRHLKEGQKLLSSEHFEQAAEEFGAAIELDRTLMMAHYGLGQARMGLKQYPQAVTAFTAAREAFNARKASVRDGQLNSDAKRDDRIRLLQDRIRELQGQPPPRSTTEASTRQLRTQQWEAEIQALQSTQGLDGVIAEPPGLAVALGSAYFRSNKMADAEREYRAALALNPKLGEPRNNLAVVLLLTGRAVEAQEQMHLAEKNGYRVPPGLKRDIEEAVQKASARGSN